MSRSRRDLATKRRRARRQRAWKRRQVWQRYTEMLLRLAVAPDPLSQLVREWERADSGGPVRCIVESTP